MTEELKPCPWCAAGTTLLKENRRMWTGQRKSEPTSVSVVHWCEPVPGQPSRRIERVGRDEASAIAAWNTRASPPPPEDGWMDISGAPKDGTEVLAWREDCGQFIASYTSADAFPLTQEEIDATDEETLFAKDWFTQWPQAIRLDGSEVPTKYRLLPPPPAALEPKEQHD